MIFTECYKESLVVLLSIINIKLNLNNYFTKQLEETHLHHAKVKLNW